MCEMEGIPMILAVFQTRACPFHSSLPQCDYLNADRFRSNVTYQSPHLFVSSQFNHWLRGGWLEDYRSKNP